MKLIRKLDELSPSFTGGAVTIGNFDGVHRGHAGLLERLARQAEAIGGPAVVFTFDPHPAHLLYPHAVPPPLTWVERKAELLGELGADVVIAYPTDQTILSLDAGVFFQWLVCDQLQARAMVEGPNFFFGQNRSASIDDLRSMCKRAGVELDVVEPLRVNDRYVSSSWIRELILAGEVRKADSLLTQPYRIRGLVVRGVGRGAKIGFPTANMDPVGMVLPPEGVYAGRTAVGGIRYAAAVHIGPNPTFSEPDVKIEVHLIGCEHTLYGASLELEFLDRLRDIRPFPDTNALQSQLASDIDAARQIAGV